MIRPIPFRLVSWLLSLGLVWLPVACGGNGNNGPGTPAVAPPQALVYATNPAVYTLGQAITANAASHGGGAVTGYTIAPALPAGLALDATAGTVTGMPTALAATAAYTVTASNSAGSTSASLSITVKDVAPSALVYAFPTATCTVGTAITPNTASHGGGVVTQFTVSPALPPGLNLNATTGLISGTPSAPRALGSYTVTASNSGGSAMATLTFTVNDLPPTGLSYAFPVITATVGTAIANNAPSSGGGAVTQYTVSPTLPAGLDLNVSTGLLSGTPTVPAAMATYTVTAGNSGGSTPFGLTITVNPAVVGKAWFSAITLSLDQPGDGSSPQIAFAGTGQAMAVWEQSGGGVESVWARRFTPGSGWSPAVVLESSTTESAVTPHVAMDAAGNALVVWLQRNAAQNTYSIWANQYAVGTGWGGAVQLEGGALGASADLRVSMDATGHGLAVWTQVGAALSALHAARYQPGSGWAAVEELATNNAGQPDLAMNASGEAMVVWSSEDVPGAVPLLFSVWGRPYNATSGWGTAVLLESDSIGGWDIVPSVAIDPVGRAVAVWQRFNSAIGRFNIRSNRYTPGGGWGAPGLIDSNLLGFSRDPRIALDADGNGLAVWDQADSGPGGHISIWGNRFTLSSGWGTAALIEAPFRAADSYPAQSPQVALDPLGNGFALWLDFGGDINGVAFTPSTGWGTPRAMAPGTTYAPGPPQVAFDGNGNAFAIWSQVTGPSSAPVNAIWVSRYE